MMCAIPRFDWKAIREGGAIGIAGLALGLVFYSMSSSSARPDPWTGTQARAEWAKQGDTNRQVVALLSGLEQRMANAETRQTNHDALSHHARSESPVVMSTLSQAMMDFGRRLERIETKQDVVLADIGKRVVRNESRLEALEKTGGN